MSKLYATILVYIHIDGSPSILLKNCLHWMNDRRADDWNSWWKVLGVTACAMIKEDTVRHIVTR